MLKKSGAELVHFRNKDYDIAHEARCGELCKLCSKFLEMAVFGANADGFIAACSAISG